jgi:hypothetical protein
VCLFYSLPLFCDFFFLFFFGVFFLGGVKIERVLFSLELKKKWLLGLWCHMGYLDAIMVVSLVVFVLLSLSFLCWSCNDKRSKIEEQVRREKLVLHNMDFRCTWFTHLFLLLSHKTFFSLSNPSSLWIKEGKELIMSMWTLFMACEFHIYLCVSVDCFIQNPLCTFKS